LADSATALDAARLLARKAAWLATVAADPVASAAARADRGPLGIEVDRAPELAALAFGLASEAARDATYVALHTHGGYGFMLEQDVQLYYRRARGWPRVWGDAGAAYRRAGARRYGREG
jgi:alkylation response protein AidB-like acyl-CoA dehydrogenase